MYRLGWALLSSLILAISSSSSLNTSKLLIIFADEDRCCQPLHYHLILVSLTDIGNNSPTSLTPHDIKHWAGVFPFFSASLFRTSSSNNLFSRLPNGLRATSRMPFSAQCFNEGWSSAWLIAGTILEISRSFERLRVLKLLTPIALTFWGEARMVFFPSLTRFCWSSSLALNHEFHLWVLGRRAHCLWNWKKQA